MAKKSDDDTPVERTRMVPDTEKVPALKSSKITTILKIVASSALLYSAISTFQESLADNSSTPRRRLMNVVGDAVPSYMDPLMKDLRDRKKLFEDTPPEEVKYWFEYTGPLQVCASFYYYYFIAYVFLLATRMIFLTLLPFIHLHFRNIFIDFQNLEERLIILKDETTPG
jgi:hypothetical protein